MPLPRVALISFARTTVLADFRVRCYPAWAGGATMENGSTPVSSTRIGKPPWRLRPADSAFLEYLNANASNKKPSSPERAGHYRGHRGADVCVGHLVSCLERFGKIRQHAKQDA